MNMLIFSRSKLLPLWDPRFDKSSMLTPKATR